ncbi:hypothetical protein L1987_78122 [Smallanthus sonchifolius]|uniref:Uncharacterized protein n=1 Tax=Smallanthus sonchifolius TaxID=185202 RepID=A0ACB8ZBT8_9ASTR|nr:hypothetical protein L1987_78122 [Smallanthus sonchifolius]
MLEVVLRRVELSTLVRPAWEERFSGGGRSGCHVVGLRKGEMNARLIASVDAFQSLGDQDLKKNVGGGRNGRLIAGVYAFQPAGEDRKKNVGGRQQRIGGKEFSDGEVSCRRKGEMTVGLIAGVDAF